MAFFYKGLVYECNVLVPLTIEGRQIPVDGDPPLAALRQLAHQHIDGPEYLALWERRDEHVKQLRACAPPARDRAEPADGARRWNEWRREHSVHAPILVNAELDDLDFSGFDLSYANLTGTKMRGCGLRGTNFHHAILSATELRGADFTKANLCATDLYQAKAPGATFIDTNLQGVHLVETDLEDATLINCTVYGLSAWDVKGTPKEQRDFRVKFRRLSATSVDPDGRVEDEVTVDDLEMAHFTYSALHNSQISRAISAAGRKTVLLLGRFKDPSRRAVLDALRDRLRAEHYIPMIFDFERPGERDLIETIKLLAGLSLFVIADISDPRSTPQELEAIAPSFQVPIVTIVQEPESEFSTFIGLMKYSWVFVPLQYDTVSNLMAGFKSAILEPALAMSRARIEARQLEFKPRHIHKFLQPAQ